MINYNTFLTTHNCDILKIDIYTFFVSQFFPYVDFFQNQLNSRFRLYITGYIITCCQLRRNRLGRYLLDNFICIRRDMVKVK